MKNCNVCGRDEGSNWVVFSQPAGVDRLPFSGNLAHEPCRAEWSAKQSTKHTGEHASPGYVSGTLINDVAGARPFTREESNRPRW